MDNTTLTLNSPITEEQWDMIADYDFNYTNEITFHTKHGKKVRFVKEPQWIPCSERLPEKPGQYYVSGRDKVWICEFLIIPNFAGGWCNNIANPVVKAWMPLPPSYKGDKT